MKKELDDKLVKDFPNLYSDRHGDIMQTCMIFGFECGDGWYDLIRELSAKIENLILQMPKEERKFYRASQVKEKYGTLRFYMTAETDEMDEAIMEAERKSAITCEICGEPGKLYGGGWVKTLCPKCAEDLGYYVLAEQ